MTKVVVHDCLPGTGKSTRMIDKINNSNKDVRYIVVTPFLKECHRYAGTILDVESQDKNIEDYVLCYSYRGEAMKFWLEEKNERN